MTLYEYTGFKSQSTSMVGQTLLICVEIRRHLFNGLHPPISLIISDAIMSSMQALNDSQRPWSDETF